jgi:hypothetical protein
MMKFSWTLKNKQVHRSNLPQPQLGLNSLTAFVKDSAMFSAQHLTGSRKSAPPQRHLIHAHISQDQEINLCAQTPLQHSTLGMW